METKKCPRYGKIKSFKEFHTKGKENRLNSWCKECVYKKQRNRWKDRKRKSVELMGGRCQICGYDKNLSALDFHHKYPSEKEFSFSKLRQMKWASVVKELKKCILFCANCHREIHNPGDNKKEILEDNNFLNYTHKITNKNQSYVYLISTGKCPTCNSDVFGTKYCCVDCVGKDKRKVKDRPSKTKLKQLLKKSNFSAIGREYRVSDNAIRKWAKSYNIL